jgi:hypothetical protein
MTNKTNKQLRADIIAAACMMVFCIGAYWLSTLVGMVL